MGKQPAIDSCPCGSGQSLDACCGRYLSGQTPAPTAEALMRSRYTAYALGQRDYLLQTWHPTTRPTELTLQANAKWIRLKIIDATDNEVEFIATFRLNGKAEKLHERSRFVFEHGQWFYVDGVTD